MILSPSIPAHIIMDIFNSTPKLSRLPYRSFINAVLLICFSGSSLLASAANQSAATQGKTPITAQSQKPKSTQNRASIEQRAENTVKRSFKAYVGENTQALLALYHPQSSLRQETAEAVQTYFDENTLIGELVEAKYLSHDKDYAYVTAKVITRDVGPNIRLSKYERDVLFILKPYGNAYLIWVFRTLDNPVLNETTF